MNDTANTYTSNTYTSNTDTSSTEGTDDILSSSSFPSHSCLPIPVPDEAVQTMANIINYLNVSLYEGQFTYNHEQARASLNAIYDAVSAVPTVPPSLEDCCEFYKSMDYLTNVTDTDDPTYYAYKKMLHDQVVKRRYSSRLIIT